MNSTNPESLQNLEVEAQELEAQGNYELAWLIRQQIQEIAPDAFNNLLDLISLSIQLKKFDECELILAALVQQLLSIQSPELDLALLGKVLEMLLALEPANEWVVQLAEFGLKHVSQYPPLGDFLLNKAADFLNQNTLPKLVAIRYNEIAVDLQPNNFSFVIKLINLYQEIGHYPRSCKLAEYAMQLAENVLEHINTRYLLVRGWLRCGNGFQKANEFHQEMNQLKESLFFLEEPIDTKHLFNLIVTNSFFSYLADHPISARSYQNKFAQFWQSNVKKAYFSTRLSKSVGHQKKLLLQKNKPLKIGYLSTCLRRHSVGHIARWLLYYHDRSRFEVYAYSLHRTNDSIQNFIANNVSEFRHSLEKGEAELYEAIVQDEIDILVDLDSLTHAEACTIVALKPAPVQVTWLGFDASGIPAIDYFIADPYVLPESAQDYYQETIWRLPDTYLALDGFAVGVPTLHREDLNIPNDAVIYFSVQSGYKRNPTNVRLQMQILKGVPNSYFLIKGFSNYAETAMKNFFEQIAEEEGVSSDRLRFLPEVDREEIHRANLEIADVVLDTYPYTGATTTLETLWMGIPLVTRVGEQFSARNSYTMLMNVGVTEGIAWSDEEYVEWGIRLGKDADLRQQISWKLLQSRRTSPLWNTRKFAREMEKAYEQMWEKYLSNNR